MTVRDNSLIDCKENKLFANFYQFSTPKLPATHEKRLIKRNSIEGTNEFHSSVCYMF